MSIGLIGVGRMGRVLATVLAPHIELCIFDRDLQKMLTLAEELSLSTVKGLEEMGEKSTIILAVPDHEVVSCIKTFNQIQKPIRIINIATNVDQPMLERIAASHVKCICIKLIGHADEMARGEKPVIIVNPSPAELVPEMVELFQLVGTVLVDKADIVHRINRIAAEKALEAAVMIEESLRQEHITNHIMVKSAIKQVAAGILKAYADDNMGPFAREIIQSIKSKLHSN